MNLTFELDLVRVSLNWHAIYPGYRSFSSVVVVRTIT